MLNVDLSIRAADGQGVVALDGNFDLADAPAVTSYLIAAIAACGPSVIVDLAALESIGFAGLGVLLRIRRWSLNSGGDLPLAAPQLPVRHVLEAAGLLDVFAIYRSVDEAARGARQAQPPIPATSIPGPPLSVPPQARSTAISSPKGGNRPTAAIGNLKDILLALVPLRTFYALDPACYLPKTSAFSALMNRGCHGCAFVRNRIGFFPGNTRRRRPGVGYARPDGQQGSG